MKLFYSSRATLRLIGLLAFVQLSFASISHAQCTTVDQSQLNYNGGMSARNLPQYTVWQSFTSGSAGTLCKIDVGFFNAMTGVGTFNLFAGMGTSGTLLQTQTVTVSGTGNFFQTFNVSAAVVVGGVYTFQFIPTQGGGLPDPYGLQIQLPGTYAGGELETTDPSGTSVTGMDMVFKTYVDVSTSVNNLSATALEMALYPNPFATSTTLKANHALTNASFQLTNVLGQVVKQIVLSGDEWNIDCSDLQAGIYNYCVVSEGKIIANQKLVIMNK